MPRCPRCKHRVPRGDLFCFECGYEMKPKDTRYDKLILACLSLLVALSVFIGWWTMQGGYLFRARSFVNALDAYCHGNEKEQEKALATLDGYCLERKDYHWEAFDPVANTESLANGNHTAYGKLRETTEKEREEFERYLAKNNTGMKEIQGLKAMDADIDIVSDVDVIRMPHASLLIYKCREKWRVMLAKGDG